LDSARTKRHRAVLSVQAKLDKAYDDRLAGGASEELCMRRSREWEAELAAIRSETAKVGNASHDYAVTAG